MTDTMSRKAILIFDVGSQVVTLKDVTDSQGRIQHSRGAVAMVVQAPSDSQKDYRLRFPGGDEALMCSSQLTTLAKFKGSAIGENRVDMDRRDLFDYVIFQAVVGSQAYGLADCQSDVDRRGFYLPPSERHWSLAGVPEQLECHETQESYWEIEKFLRLALKANPNVLECLYSPLVEKATPLAEELLGMRQCFLSRLVYQTYNGYAMSQFRKMEADLRNTGSVKWKHAMHLIRVLASGIRLLQEGTLLVEVEAPMKQQLLRIKSGEMAWEELTSLHRQLTVDFEAAAKTASLPETPDYEAANAFLIRARRSAVS